MEVDLNKYDWVRGVSKNANRYEVLGGELFKTDINSRKITVVYRAGQSFKQRARFKNAGVTELIFEAE